MAFFCAELPSPLMVPVGQSAADPEVLDPVAFAPEDPGEFASEPHAVKLAARTRQAGNKGRLHGGALHGVEPSVGVSKVSSEV